MKFTFENFKQYENESIELPDKGLTLLSGKSGSGKSTIFKAMVFALYGKSKTPITYGKNSCKVVLEWNKMIVTRTCPPNKVVVNIKRDVQPASNKNGGIVIKKGIYTETEAVSVIEYIVEMNYVQFMQSCYIVQRERCSIISMSASEQFKFLQDLISKNINQDQEEHKRMKDRITQFKDNLYKLQGSSSQIEISFANIKKELSKNNINISDIKDLKDYNEKDLQEKILNLQNEKKKIESEILQLNDTNLISLQDKKDRLAQNLDLLSMKKSNMKRILNEEINILKEEKQTITNKSKNTTLILQFIELLYKRDELSCKFENTNSKFNQIEFNEIEKKYRDFEEKKQSYLLIKSKIKNITQIKNGQRTKINSIIEKISFLYSFNPVNDKLSDIITEISTLFESKTNILQARLNGLNSNQAQTFSCPCCKTKVYIKGDKMYKYIEKKPSHSSKGTPILEPIKDEPEETIEEFKASIENLKKFLDEIKTLYKDYIASLDEFKDLTTKEKVCEKGLHEFNNIKQEYENYSLLKLEYTNLKNNIGLKNSFDKVKQDILTYKDYDFYNELISKKRGIKENELNEYIIQKEELNESSNEVTMKINSLMEKKLDYDNIEKECNDLTSHISLLEKKIATVLNTLKILSKSKGYDVKTALTNLNKNINNVNDEIIKLSAQKNNNSIIQNYNKIFKELNEKQKEITALEMKKDGYEGLYESNKLARVIALDKIINNINGHAKYYLNEMFRGSHICVKLQNIKKKSPPRGGKNTGDSNINAKINLYINYKGNEVAISDLSGGEVQRVELAYLLAVNDVMASNIIMLDECLNNLDAFLNTEILSFLKEYAKGKQIIVASHEAVEGIFDYIHLVQ
jgi:exonuclease SbcC